MKLLRAILQEPWMINQATKDAWMPMVLRMVNGQTVDFKGEGGETHEPFAHHPKMQSSYSNFSNAPSGSVAVFPIVGPITKFDGWCNYGTESLMKRMKQADQQSNIVGHLLEIDSGGGQGTNLETVAGYLRNEISKPIVAWYNGTNASAAYYISLGADEIYASEDTDIVGSLGVMLTFADMRKMYEDKGITIHEVYADQSSLKNDDFRKARDGEYEIIQKNYLNPYAQKFIDLAKMYRPGITQEDVFKGKVYMTQEAISLGMIDGKLSFEQAIQRVTNLASSSGQTNNSTNMKRIQAILGYELEMQDGGVFLRQDELTKLERRIVLNEEVPVPEASIVSINSTLEGLNEKMTTIGTDLQSVKEANATTEEAITDIKATLAVQDTELKRIGGAPGAGATRPASAGDPQDDDVSASDNPLKELDAATAEADDVIFE